MAGAQQSLGSSPERALYWKMSRLFYVCKCLVNHPLSAGRRVVHKTLTRQTLPSESHPYTEVGQRRSSSLKVASICFGGPTSVWLCIQEERLADCSLLLPRISLGTWLGRCPP